MYKMKHKMYNMYTSEVWLNVSVLVAFSTLEVTLWAPIEPNGLCIIHTLWSWIHATQIWQSNRGSYCLEDLSIKLRLFVVVITRPYPNLTCIWQWVISTVYVQIFEAHNFRGLLFPNIFAETIFADKEFRAYSNLKFCKLNFRGMGGSMTTAKIKHLENLDVYSIALSSPLCVCA